MEHWRFAATNWDFDLPTQEIPDLRLKRFAFSEVWPNVSETLCVNVQREEYGQNLND